VDAKQGGLVPLVSSPLLGDAIQAAPAGIFTTGFQHILVGTRNAASDNAFCALIPADLTLSGGAPCFTGSAPNTIGVVSAMATVEYGTPPRVYFTSRRRDATSSGDTTQWCLELGAAPTFSPNCGSRRAGDVDASPIAAADASGARRVYMPASGDVRSLPLHDLTVSGRLGASADGPVRGFAFPDRSHPGDLFFATDRFVWLFRDDGSTFGPKTFTVPPSWPQGAISLDENNPPNVRPSSPVLLVYPYLYVGASNGRLYQIDVSDCAGAATCERPGLSNAKVKAVTLGVGNAVVGAPSYDLQSGLIHVGTEAGVYYAVKVPLP
jgi:hypothetical protein